MEDAPVLCFKNFSFTYKAQTEPTLCGINLTVRRGEKILILGPSGSGKSTLAHCVNGLIPHVFPGLMEGSLFIMGEDAEKLEIFEKSKKVGTVLQDTDGQFVGLSAGEDIAFAAENDVVPVEEMHRRTRETAALVQIEDHLGKSPQELSGGQKQRVAMAGVLMDQVEILLFDEPLANLDPATGKHAVELIDTLHQGAAGKTILIIEHRLEDALHRSVDRIVLMDKGRIIADDTPQEILASALLRETGIREPLYISALRYAGIPVTAETRPENVATILFDGERLRQWERGLGEAEQEAEGPPLLELRDLTFQYDSDKKPALQNVSLSIAKGSAVSLVGKNGAGKSTLASLVCGFYKPQAGAIFFEGKDMAGLSIRERAERIGCVMQNPNQMISHPLIYDEAAFGLRVRGLGENETREKVYETLKTCGLYPFRNWPVSALSFGQKKRLTIASILVLGPSLLILDEPTAGQDLRHYAEIMEFLRKLNREQGITFLLITHDMHLMLEYSSRAIVLADGKTLIPPGGDDSPAAVLTDSVITGAASLKLTSLYDLALRAGIENPSAFVRHFIARDRAERG